VTRLHDLFDHEGQSPWIDDLKRTYVTERGLDELVALGIRGVTSNPTIMTKAIEAGGDYDVQFAALIGEGVTVEDAYWDLVLQDVAGALEILRPTFESSSGTDGFVSVEVSPALAHDTSGTIEAARKLWERLDRPNALIKIPATLEGLPAIEDAIASGISVNVTLIFSLDRYGAVIDAYLSGLERFASQGGDISKVASVASFFVSRVDTEIDRRLDAIAQQGPAHALALRAHGLRGKAAISQARLAYALFEERFATKKARSLLASGARVQRPLWASTSTKNPAYPDLLYVDGLIGPDTVNTMPAATVAAFVDHGQIARTVDLDVEFARQILSDLKEIGINIDEVTDQLEAEGVASFAKSFDELHERLVQKAASLGSSS
jgi:transaldolase